jgi:hypothetical protein
LALFGSFHSFLAWCFFIIFSHCFFALFRHIVSSHCFLKLLRWGLQVQWDYVERPQVAQDDDGTVLALYLGQSYKDSHSLAIMFCQDGDTDCVTTVQ